MTFPRIKPFLAVVIAAAGLNFASATGSLSQDFDCRQARTAAERTICASSGLRSLDQRMAESYGQLWSVMGQKGYAGIAFVRLQNEQRGFLASRDACITSAWCLRSAYWSRIRQLDGRVHETLTAKG